jgi:Domain of unknown function (DUF4112)
MPGSISNPRSDPPNAETPGISLTTDRWNRGAWLFRDRTLHGLEILLDEAFRIPGTSIRFGLDGIIGLVPGLGDVLAGLLSLIIPLAAWIRGVPYVTLARMAANLGIGVLVGSIPLFGDIFDIAWKANRRNYRLLCRHLDQPRRHTWRDWAFLWFLATVLALIFAIPVALAIWLISWLGHALGHSSGLH